MDTTNPQHHAQGCQGRLEQPFILTLDGFGLVRTLGGGVGRVHLTALAPLGAGGGEGVKGVYPLASFGLSSKPNACLF